MHSVSLSFRLRLSSSMDSGMAIWMYTSHLNYHLAIHTQKSKYVFFKMSGQIAIQLFSIKKAGKFLNSRKAIQLYTSRSAIHTQTQSECITRLFLFLYLYLYLFFISSECLFGVTKRFICLHNKLHLFT